MRRAREFYLLALKIATRAHRGQRDKQGIAYINHPVAVAKAVSGLARKTVAVLHDVVEDTSVTQADIDLQFPGEIAWAVDAMTRREGELYKRYIERVALNDLAKAVKLADIAHNLSRPYPGSEGMERRYRPAVAFLTTGRWPQAE